MLSQLVEQNLFLKLVHPSLVRDCTAIYSNKIPSPIALNYPSYSNIVQVAKISCLLKRTTVDRSIVQDQSRHRRRPSGEINLPHRLPQPKPDENPQKIIPRLLSVPPYVSISISIHEKRTTDDGPHCIIIVTPHSKYGLSTWPGLLAK